MKKIILLLILLSAYFPSYSQDYGIKYYIEWGLYVALDGNEKIGILDKKGHLVKDMIYDKGAAYNNIINVTKDNIYGYLTKDNSEKFFPQFKKAYWDTDVGIAQDENKKYALIDLEGSLITNYIFDYIRRINKDFYFVKIDNKGNYISLKGDLIFDSKYNMIDQGVINFTGCFKSDNNKYGLVKSNGIVVLDGIFDKIIGREDSPYWAVENNGKYGLIDRKGKEVIPQIYDKISYVPRKNTLIPVVKNGKCGYINDKNQVSIPFIYEAATPFIDGFAIVKKNGIYGYINENNKELAFFGTEPFSIGEKYFHDGLAIFKLDGKYGYVDKQGTIMIKPIYDEVENFRDGIARVKVGELYGFINKHGEAVIPIKYLYLSNVNDSKILFQL